MRPNEKRLGDFLSYTFEDYGIKVDIERVHDDRGNIYGTMAIWHENGDGLKFIERERLNLLNTTARDKFVQSLHEYRSKQVNWLSILDWVIFLTIEAMRSRQPLMSVGYKPPKMSLDYVLAPWIEKGQATTIFAPGGSGKSYLADYVAVLVQCNVAGVHGWLPEWCNVLYLDYESEHEEHLRRVYAIKRGLKIEHREDEIDQFKYRRCRRPLAEEVTEIQKIVLENEIGLIIVDSQHRASGKGHDMGQIADEYYDALCSLNTTSLTIDHTTKTQDDGNKGMPYGSVMKWNASRAQFEVKSYNEPGDTYLELGIFCRKRNDGLKLPPMGVRVQWFMDTENHEELDKVQFTTLDIAESEELSKDLPSGRQIAALLKGGSLNTTEIIKALDHINENTITSALKRGRKDKRFVYINDRWGLASHDGDGQ